MTAPSGSNGEPRLISMWSGPRTVSTAMMYSWRERTDTEVVDEPWYARYLLGTGVDHPVTELVIQAQPTTVDGVVEWICSPGDRPIRFLKNMAHHLQGLDRGERRMVLDLSTNFLLVRDPAEMLPSLADRLGRTQTIDQTGLPEQVEILELAAVAGAVVPVVESGRLLADPRSVLTRLCGALSVDFDERVLGWPAGPKPEDGVWAAHWYSSVHRSTGFGSAPGSGTRDRAPRVRDRPAPGGSPDLDSVLEECRPLYELIVAEAF